MSRLVIGFVATIALSILGCTDSTGPHLGPDLSPPPASLAISDGAHGGAAGFYFLPPLVAEPEYDGIFDPAREPEVRIVCTGASGPGCPILRSFITPTIKVDVDAESYEMVWKVGKIPELELGRDRYRLEVHDGGQLLGFVDLWFVDRGSAREDVGPGYAPVLTRGAFSIRFRIEEGTAPPNAPPIAYNDAFETDAGTPVSGNVLENDSDPNPLDVLSAILENGPSSGTLSSDPDGTFLYTPDTGFDGEDTFSYRASDGELTSELATVTITVHPLTVGPSYRPLALGRGHSCMLDDDGSAWCWGSNSSGQVGDGNPVNAVTSPTAVVGGLRFVHLAAGSSHTCALDADGVAFCWGWNLEGQLGSGGTAHGYVPLEVVGGRTFLQLAANGSATCGLETDATTWCWGSGALGHPTVTFSTMPIQVPTDLRFMRLLGGGGLICGLVIDGRAYCWGDNATGQYGDGSITSSRTPVASAGGMLLEHISPYDSHTCGIDVAGVSFCWGRNSYGQLGSGDFVDSLNPVQVAGGLQLVGIATATWHSCGLDGVGAAWCWGYNRNGHLGTGTATQTPIPTPQPVTGNHRFDWLATGEQHACGRTFEGRVLCWGLNSAGQLGVPSLEQSAVPIEPGSLH